MNCKVILNINGIETTSSIMLEDGFDKNDAVIQIKRKLQSILDKDSIEESEKDSLYYAALNIYSDVYQKIQNQKSLKDNFKESYTFNSIYDVPELYFPYALNFFPVIVPSVWNAAAIPVQIHSDI